ncbi:hypothetical protein [Sphingomonas sp. CV7422]|uniref:hypothetical protein n=1 Tax=Sphingomonas sp. CV7422 TaxID=3018036 RepID=UPI0022FE6BF9|nr:hypothetical protein [Sphingomonas sp. CV7422]
MNPREVYGEKLFIPKQLSEIQDHITTMAGEAPLFTEITFYGYPRTIDNEFYRLREGLSAVKDKLGGSRFEKVVDLTNKAKALFLADPQSATGDASKGVTALMDVYDILEQVRGERYHAGILDFEGILSGD